MSTELVLIEIQNPLQVFSTPKGLDCIIDKIEAEAKSIDRDISTEAGRDNIRSLAFKLAKSKTALDKMGKELTEEQRSQINAVNAERKRAWDRMEALQAEIRAPLTEWEQREELRVQGHEKAIADVLALLPTDLVNPGSAAIQARIDAYNQLPERDWQEFAQRADLSKKEVALALQAALVTATKSEAEAAELARLRAEEQARQQKERDDRIAAEAAAKAKADAEAIAAAAAKAAAEREEKERQDKIAAQQRADAAEKAAKAAADKAALDAVLAAALAETEKQKAAEAAAQKERDRQAAEKAAEEKATAKRAADTAHKSKINNEALTPILLVLNSVQAGTATAEQAAKEIVTRIARGEIPHVSIKY